MSFVMHLCTYAPYALCQRDTKDFNEREKYIMSPDFPWTSIEEATGTSFTERGAVFPV